MPAIITQGPMLCSCDTKSAALALVAGRLSSSAGTEKECGQVHRIRQLLSCYQRPFLRGCHFAARLSLVLASVKCGHASHITPGSPPLVLACRQITLQVSSEAHAVK